MTSAYKGTIPIKPPLPADHPSPPDCCDFAALEPCVDCPFPNEPEARLAIATKALTAIRDRLWTDGEPYDERIGDLKWLAAEALQGVSRS